MGLIGGFTPGAARVLARPAAQLPSLENRAQMRELAGLPVDPSQIQRWVQLLGPEAQAWLPQLPGPPAAALRRGLVQADTGIYLDDRAARVWEVARTCILPAVQMLDYYHAREHVGALAKQSGMFWTEVGATALLSLRCALLSAGGRDQLWSQPLLQAP